MEAEILNENMICFTYTDKQMDDFLDWYGDKTNETIYNNLNKTITKACTLTLLSWP